MRVSDYRIFVFVRPLRVKIKFGKKYRNIYQKQKNKEKKHTTQLPKKLFT